MRLAKVKELGCRLLASGSVHVNPRFDCLDPGHEHTLQLLCQWDEELIARAIHDRSRRKDRAFVKVNCAAIPAGLLGRDLISSIIGLKNRQFFVNGHTP
jgi:Sigma-54 interaction domain